MAKTDTRAPAELQRIEDSLVFFLNAYRRSRARLHRDPHLKRLTLAQFAVLQAVSRNGAQGITRIAAEADLTQPPATRALQRLEKEGLVRRRSASADRRVTAVELTAAGSRLLRYHRGRLRHAAREIYDSISPGEHDHAAELLARLGEALERLA